MKKIITIMLFFTLTLFAKDLSINYGVTFGAFGELGLATIDLSESGDKYTITVRAKTTGIAKTLSSNRQEKHISKGHIVDGKYISDSYEVIVSYKNKENHKIYTINHNDKTVQKQIIRKVDGEVKKFQIIELPYYSNNDLLTLYMNLPKLIKLSNDKEQHYSFKAVGAENQSGTIDIHVLAQEQLAEYKEKFGDLNNSVIIKAIINQPIFTSKNGEIVIAIDKDGVTQKAILANLLIFGDIEAIKK